MNLPNLLLFFSICLIITLHPAHSQNLKRGTPEEAVALVKKVKKMWFKIGPEKTIENVNKLREGLRQRDLYPFIMHTDGYMVAHFVQSLRGISLTGNVNDTTIRVFSRMVAVIKTNGKGWVHYDFINPIKKTDESKSAYLELITDGYFVGVGVYKPEE